MLAPCYFLATVILLGTELLFHIDETEKIPVL